MIDRQGNTLIFECDACDETFDAGTSDFNTAWTEAKTDGWRAYRLPSGEWLHSCISPQCRSAVNSMCARGR